MTTENWINILSIIVLLLFGVALIYLIIVLHRANRVMSRIDHLGNSFREFAGQLVPAIINIGSVMTAVQAVLHRLSEPNKTIKPKKGK